MLALKIAFKEVFYKTFIEVDCFWFEFENQLGHQLPFSDNYARCAKLLSADRFVISFDFKKFLVSGVNSHIPKILKF